MSGPVETDADGTAPSATVGKFFSFFSPDLHHNAIDYYMTECLNAIDYYMTECVSVRFYYMTECVSAMYRFSYIDLLNM
jgi:hypothetical protein